MTQVRRWSMLTAVAILAVFALGWFLLIAPKRGEVSSLRSEAEAQEQANANLRGRIAVLKAQAADLPRQQARLAEVAVNLPPDPQLPTLIRTMSSAAAQSGAELLSLSPGVPVAVADPATAAQANPPAAKPGSAQLAAVPVTVTAAGDYFEVEQFLNKIEGMKRVFLVTGIVVAPVTQTNPAPSPGTVQASITGRVFMTTTVAPPAKPVAAGTAGTAASPGATSTGATSTGTAGSPAPAH